jgi:uncharacterized protein
MPSASANSGRPGPVTPPDTPRGHAGKAGRPPLPELGLPTGVPAPGARFRIAADGTWFHDGGPILRPEMVKLFARILRREAGADGRPAYALVTPHERHEVTVEDAPFVAVALRSEGEGRLRRVVFVTNIDVEVVAGPAHPIVVRSDSQGGPRPYLGLDGDMEALIARSVYYDLAALAEANEGVLGVWSGGMFFPLDPA